MSADIKIHISKSCAACSGTGKVPASEKTWGGLDKFYDHSYCPCCKGEGYSEVWISIPEFKLILDRL